MFKDNTILLVEDNKDMQKYVKLLLEDDCKQLFIASDGIEGIEQYTKNKPDLIITDLNMPLMDGITMSKEIREKDIFIPIVLLTAHGDINELQEAINMGLNAFISKPIENIEILFSTIQKLLIKSNKIKILREKGEVCKSKEKSNNLAHNLLHDDEEYVDFEMLVGNIK